MIRIKCPQISPAEMNNKCGAGRHTDAPNVMAVAAQLAAHKAERAFEHLLPQIGERLTHVLQRVMQLSRLLVTTSSQINMSYAGAPLTHPCWHNVGTYERNGPFPL